MADGRKTGFAEEMRNERGPSFNQGSAVELEEMSRTKKTPEGKNTG